jgi:gluconokinase
VNVDPLEAEIGARADLVTIAFEYAGGPRMGAMSPATDPCRCVVVSGVAGSGKTTVGQVLATRLGWTFAEGDLLHPERNIALMRAGIPLTDADRAGWLDAIGGWIDQNVPELGAVVACSALRRTYRDHLAEGRPWLRFCQLVAPKPLLRSRIIRRRGHFMPVSLLSSQLETLEPLEPDEAGIVVDGSGDPNVIAETIVEALQLVPLVSP